MHIGSLNCNWWWMPAPSISKFTFFWCVFVCVRVRARVCVCVRVRVSLSLSLSLLSWWQIQQPRKRGLTLSGDKRFFTLPRHLDWLLHLTHPPAQLILGPLSPEVKHDAYYSPPSNVEVKNELSYSSHFLCACVVSTGVMSPLHSVKLNVLFWMW